MNDPHRRYEILLPLRFNDGKPVPEELIGQTFADLERQYGALSWESQTIHGKWRYQGEAFRDDQVRVFVDVPDTPENRRFFVSAQHRQGQGFQTRRASSKRRRARRVALASAR
jgi:hypothetical protein